jgi:hypothetical protein
MNKIEKFIVQNRDLFDTEDVPGRVWEKIKLPESNKQTQRKSIIKPLYKWGAAAAIAGILFTGAYLFFQNSKQDKHSAEGASITANTEKNKEDSNDNFSPEDIKNTTSAHIPEVENIYKAVVEKQNELKDIADANPELYRQFASDLAILDSSYHVLKSEASSSPNHDVFIKAMIQNLQLQAELLSRQLSIIHQYKNSKNKSYETNNKRSI